MIYIETKIKTSDNSGAVLVKCVNFKSAKCRYASLNSIISVVIRRRYNPAVIKKKRYLGLVVSVKKKVCRADGSFIRFEENRIVLFSTKFKLLSTKLKGTLCNEVKWRLVNLKERDNYKQLIPRAPYLT